MSSNPVDPTTPNTTSSTTSSSSSTSSSTSSSSSSTSPSSSSSSSSSSPPEPTTTSTKFLTTAASPSQKKFTPEELEKITAYIATTKKVPIRLRHGVFNGHRVTYCKGKHILTALNAHPTYQSLNLNVLIKALIIKNWLIHVEKLPKQKRVIATSSQTFDPTGYYVLRYEPNPLYMTLGAIALVCVVLAAVMFPLWPDFMKTGVVYLSYGLLGLLGFILVLAVIRLILFVPLWIIGKPGWLFPNLFADAGIIESFQPIWAWDETKSSSSSSSTALELSKKDN